MYIGLGWEKLKIMIRNFITTLIRISQKNRLFTVLNLTGLTIGIAGVLMILVWITHELSFDKHYNDADQIYRVMSYGTTYMQDGFAGVPAVLIGDAVEKIPEVTTGVAFEPTGRIFMEANSQGFYENNGLFADSSFFTIFNLSFIQGDPEVAFSDIHSIILTRAMAMKFFGRVDVVNELVMGDEIPLKVSSVIEDFPEYSTLQTDFILPYTLVHSLGLPPRLWGRFMSVGYIKIVPGIDPLQLAQKLTDYAMENNCPQVKDGVHFELQPISAIHLDGSHNESRVFYKSGNKNHIKAFSIIAIFLLTIACFNYINLTTARMEKRSKEIGMRKVVGSSRIQLIRQFIGESMVLSLISLILAFILVEILRPGLNNLLGADIGIHYTDFKLILGVLIILFFSGFLAGTYPALIQSRLSPISIINPGAHKGSSRDILRKFLVVGQFFIASVLISVSFYFIRQNKFLINKDLGFNKENVVYLPMKENITEDYYSLKNRLLDNPGILNVSAINIPETAKPSRCTGCFTWQSQDNPESTSFDALLSSVDFDYFETLQIPIIKGRSFSTEYSTDSIQGFIINESAARKMNVDDPLEEYCRLSGFSEIVHEGQIIGISKDIYVSGLKEEIAPQIFRVSNDLSSMVPDGVIYVRYKEGFKDEVIDELSKVWNEVNDLTPFEYFYLDQTYIDLYRPDRINGMLVTWFTIFIILVSCLGVYGMITFFLERKRREIALRKTFGASSYTLIWKTTWSIGKWAIIANLASIPFTIYISKRLFESYANRIDLNWDVFPISFAILFIIICLTTLIKALKIIYMNPAESLKYE